MQSLSEQKFIEELVSTFPPPAGVVGIGDDCAVIPGDDGMSWLVTTDALVEGIHFLKEWISPEDLGYKSIAVSVSDIAAMGGKPKYAFLSIAMPKITEAAWASKLILGMKEACLEWDLNLLGGDTVGSPQGLFLNLTLIGIAEQGKILHRHGAKVGDLICVTSNLGDSGGGLRILQENLSQSEESDFLLQAHFRPKPSFEKGMWLASQKGVHAMMDLSDGLDCDLRRLVQSSHTGASIQIEKIPLSEPLDRLCKKQGWDPLELALTGGEDYCLLFTVDPSLYVEVQSSFQNRFGVSFFEIGSITSSPSVSYFKKGKPADLKYKPFNHFE